MTIRRKSRANQMQNNRRSCAFPPFLAAIFIVSSNIGTALAAPKAAVTTLAGMTPVLDSDNLHSETLTGQLLPAVKDDLARVYASNLRGNSVTVIDSATLKVVTSLQGRASPYCSLLGDAHLVGGQSCRARHQPRWFSIH